MFGNRGLKYQERINCDAVNRIGTGIRIRVVGSRLVDENNEGLTYFNALTADSDSHRKETLPFLGGIIPFNTPSSPLKNHINSTKPFIDRLFAYHGRK